MYRLGTTPGCDDTKVEAQELFLIAHFTRVYNLLASYRTRFALFSRSAWHTVGHGFDTSILPSNLNLAFLAYIGPPGCPIVYPCLLPQAWEKSSACLVTDCLKYNFQIILQLRLI